MGVMVHAHYHGVAGQPGSHRCLRATCPVHKGREADCRTGRVFSEKYGKASGLGDQEAFAFVGCWLRGASTERFRHDAKAHREWKPSVAEVQAYAQSMGWV